MIDFAKTKDYNVLGIKNTIKYDRMKEGEKSGIVFSV
jgi:hypothetical protein